MPSFPPTIILRHRKENLKKCSLRGLEERDDMLFFRYPIPDFGDIDFNKYVLLSLDGEELSEKDGDKGVVLIDGTWRYAQKMVENTTEFRDIPRRRLPEGYTTAYPRCQTECPDPEAGLASVEALYVAYSILGRDTTGILDNYHWKKAFLKKNAALLLGSGLA
ncbi:MAG: DTW domain-containing protein [Waddliaceae bacterium]|nr:DTW domain-containing protein [Waddliaceae bacterium]MBT3579385.1 DTW domain-containing protein [Waddliaceae bacterium]MBT4444870.1 DTW domain-containing protein [Waddliaceae bacterium]MBT6927953.1 DTW domain-containing protein [Waddliaceae bacterium]MBT7263931.1 DTW domain-containing protein [Waddliaceae bacterium]